MSFNAFTPSAFSLAHTLVKTGSVQDVLPGGGRQTVIPKLKCSYLLTVTEQERELAGQADVSTLRRVYTAVADVVPEQRLLFGGRSLRIRNVTRLPDGDPAVLALLVEDDGR